MKKLIRIIIILFALSIMSFSAYKLWEVQAEYAEGENIYEGYINNFVETVKVDTGKSGDTVKVEHAAQAAEVEKKISVDFDSLIKENQDVVAWIYSENTPINYPVVQSHDNDYYLRRLLDHSYNIAGSIFMDYRNSPDFSDFNTIIYGHNLKTDTMFGSLKEYSSQEYYEKHSEIYLSTPQGDYVIELISAFRTDIDDDIYILPQNEKELEDLYHRVVEGSNFHADSSFEEGDRLITLSTCSDYGDEDVRYILIGKLLSI